MVHQPVQEVHPIDHLCRAVKLISPFKRIGQGPSYLWELADAVCRKYLTRKYPATVGEGASHDSSFVPVTMPHNFSVIKKASRSRIVSTAFVLCGENRIGLS